MFWRLISKGWPLREATCWQQHYLRPFSPPTLVRLGETAHPVSACRLDVGSLPIRSKIIPFSLEIQRVCSYPPIGEHHGRISTRDFLHARCRLSRPLASTMLTCLPALLVKLSGANRWERERRRQLQRPLQLLPQAQLRRRHQHLPPRQQLLLRLHLQALPLRRLLLPPE